LRPRQPKDGRYRSKIEVLRDFLEATREESKKTRIIGAANLNPASFQRYLDSCIRLDLVHATTSGYELTARAEVVLDRIDRLLEMSSEVDSALQSLNRFLGESRAQGEAPSTPRFVSRVAWSQVSEAESPTAPSVANSATSRSVAFPLGGFKFWWEREMVVDPAGEEAGRTIPQDPATDPSLSPRRSNQDRARR